MPWGDEASSSERIPKPAGGQTSCHSAWTEFNFEGVRPQRMLGSRAEAQVTRRLAMWFMKVGLLEVFGTDTPGDMIRLQSFWKKRFPSSYGVLNCFRTWRKTHAGQSWIAREGLGLLLTFLRQH